MNKEDIEKLFQELKIPTDRLSSYSDPYSFAEQIKKASGVQDDVENISYSIGTGLIGKE